MTVGTVSEIRALARKGLAPKSPPRVNTHVHIPPNFSAFRDLDQAVDLAAAQGIGVLGLSNYYDYGVYRDFEPLAARKGVFPLFATEIIAWMDALAAKKVKINDPDNPGKIYICGKGLARFSPMNAEARRLMATIRGNDSTRMAAMVGKLAQVLEERGFKTGLDEKALVALTARRYNVTPDRVVLQERHVAQAFQERLFELIQESERPARLAAALGTPAPAETDPLKVQNVLRSGLMKAGKAAYVPETFVPLDHAIRLILELGGIPAYPILMDGANPICGFEESPEILLRNLRELGLCATEVIPIRNAPDVLSRYVKAVRAAGLVVTAGTEHNTPALIPLDPTCLKNAPVPDDLRAIFWEGACVAAAHQFLVRNGEPGFVDAAGRPNPDYADSEARIAAFRAIGEALLETYFRKTSQRKD